MTKQSRACVLDDEETFGGADYVMDFDESQLEGDLAEDYIDRIDEIHDLVKDGKVDGCVYSVDAMIDLVKYLEEAEHSDGNILDILDNVKGRAK